MMTVPIFLCPCLTQVLHGALTHFNGNLATLTGCTMEDTVQAIDAYEKARIAHDACLNELEALSQKPPTPYFNAIKVHTHTPHRVHSSQLTTTFFFHFYCFRHSTKR